MDYNKYDITEIKKKYHHLFLQIANERMEDYLLTFSINMVDSSTGEVLFNSQFSKPLSVFTNYDIIRYVDSFQRGLRQGKNVAISFIISKDRDLKRDVKQTELF